MVRRSYIFLSLLPFKYLIPTLYAKKFHMWLNIFLWVWYGASVWNSVSDLKIIKVLHLTFHRNMVNLWFNHLIFSQFYGIFIIKFTTSTIKMTAWERTRYRDVFWSKNHRRFDMFATWRRRFLSSIWMESKWNNEGLRAIDKQPIQIYSLTFIIVHLEMIPQRLKIRPPEPIKQ